MKKTVFTILIILVFLAGLLVMFYPIISNWYNEKMNSYVVSNYSEVIDTTDEEWFKDMFQKAREYNEKLHTLPKQFVTGGVKDENYMNVLNVYEGMMGYVVIEDQRINLPIYHGTDEDVLQTGVGHLEGSSLPTGDIGNNTVLTGHTGLPTASLFTDIVNMKEGDTFELYILDYVYTYEVFNINVVEPYQVDDLEAIEGKDVVTLVTCTPYGINSHRLLVQGEQISAISKFQEADILPPVNNDTELEEQMNYTLIIIGAIILILIIFLIFIIRKNWRYYQYARYKKSFWR